MFKTQLSFSFIVYFIALFGNIQLGRWYNIPKGNTVCKICSKKEIGNEFHYLFICNGPIKFQSRKSYMYIPKNFYRNRYRNPNVYKFEQLFNTKNKI